MGLTKQEIQDLIGQGVPPVDLLRGIEKPGGVVGATEKVIVKGPIEKEFVLVEITRALILADRNAIRPPTLRNIR